MLRNFIFVLPVLYLALMWALSSWRLRRELDASATLLDDPRLRPVLARLARAAGVLQVRAFVHEVPVVNGFAAPDGRIFITRGFLDQLDAGRVTEIELGGVIAHELGHVALGHTRRRMIDFAGQNAIRWTVAGLLGRIVPGIGLWLANMAAAAVAARLSRQDEYEADAYAAALMVKAGYGTAPLVSLFGKLGQTAARTKGGAAPAWLLSHPPAQQRISAIRALSDRWGRH